MISVIEGEAASIGRKAILCAAISLAVAVVNATEGGGNSYPIGVETNFSGLMPTEGLHVYGYYSNYSSSHSKDNNGNDNARLAYYKVKSNTVSVKVSYVWPGVKFLDANVMTTVAQALPTVDLTLGIRRPAPLTPLDRSGSRTNLADLAFIPISLGWHSPTLHQMVALDTFLPTGSYDVAERVNTGRNTYQVAPTYAFSWFPVKGYEAHAKFRYAVNGKNDDTNYKSGNELTAEFSGGYRVDESLAFGVNGYAYRQTTDDRQNGVSVNGNGNRGKVNALGPYVSYNFTPKVALILKVQSEFGARNRSEGNRIWLQTKVPF
jgi:hypothetical protein